MQEIKPIEQLSKKDRHALRRQEKETQRESTLKAKRIKHIARWWISVALTTLLVGGLIWYIAVSRPSISEGDIVSRSGFHWHTELAIYVKGEKQEIPANIGIGAVHQPIHTHDDSDKGIIHLEFQGLVRKQVITLGQFFKNWDNDLRSFGTNIKMTVNGEENTEYENYIMQDKDKIELRYE